MPKTAIAVCGTRIRVTKRAVMAHVSRCGLCGQIAAYVLRGQKIERAGYHNAPSGKHL